MALVRYEPWGLLNDIQREVNRLFENRPGEEGDVSSVVTSHWAPAVDIKEEKDRFIIYADLPGIDPKDIDITMEQGVLTLKGERVVEKEEERGNYRRTERARGTFYRRFSLPDTADAERVEAVGKNGVLEITIPKHERTKPRKINVTG